MIVTRTCYLQIINLNGKIGVVVVFEGKKSERELPDCISSEFSESSHIRDTLDRRRGICNGFLNSISTLTASAYGDEEQNIRVCISMECKRTLLTTAFLSSI